MIPWELLEIAPVPGGREELRLYRRGGEFSIRVDGYELMNSRVHGSEEALAELACARLADRAAPKVLIGGLGMGFTTAAALHRLGPQAQVVVAELVPAVVAWNRGPLAELAGYPLEDRRVSVLESDIARILQTTTQEAYDAILLDVDNGPDGLTRPANDWLYRKAGLTAAHAALMSRGLLAVWSASPAPAFSKLLRQSGFTVQEVPARARGRKGGSRHLIWLAERRP